MILSEDVIFFASWALDQGAARNVEVRNLSAALRKSTCFLERSGAFPAMR
jgi:hypothetical protein